MREKLRAAGWAAVVTLAGAVMVGRAVEGRRS